MKYPEIRRPVQGTLDKYGMSLYDWEVLLFQQKGVCGVCGEEPASKRLVIDHEHVRGWRHMVPEERKKYVRGLCCVTCNHFVLTRYGTVEKFRGAAAYLERYEARGKG